jgi:signal transduction histidine kinase
VAAVESSETLLERMVDNLVDNAVRHNQPRGLINVTCDTDRKTARLVIESGGSVLDREAVEPLAEPFRRLGVQRTGSQNGHGLGLSIVAAVAAAHGGECRTGSPKGSAIRESPSTSPTTATRLRTGCTSTPTTSSCSTATSRESTATPCAR